MSTVQQHQQAQAGQQFNNIDKNKLGIRGKLRKKQPSPKLRKVRKCGFIEKDKAFHSHRAGWHSDHWRKFDAFDFLFFLAKYSSQENSQAVASKECWPGDLLPETL